MNVQLHQSEAAAKETCCWHAVMRRAVVHECQGCVTQPCLKQRQQQPAAASSEVVVVS